MTAAPAFSNLSASVTDPSGNVYSFDQTQHQPTSVIAITDPNGNQITSTPSGLKDTAGYTVLTASAQTGTSTYTYPGPTGNVSVILNYTSFIQKTNFQCPYVGDFPAAGVSLPTTISMPDGTSYTIVYESTDGTYPSTTITGRIHSLTRSPGSTVTYIYSGPNNGIDCQLATPLILTKQTPDGTWTYTRTKPPFPNLGPSTVKVTDPAGNDTVYTFDYDGTHELQRVTYQGPASSNIVLQTTLTCYNGNFTGCNNKVGIGPVTQKDLYKYPGTSAVAPSLSETLYNSTGQMTGDKEYDFGATLPPGNNFVRNTTITYGSYNSGTCAAITGVIDHPCSTVTTNQSGTTLARTNNTYNTANGNLTNVSKLAGSGYVNTAFSNNPNGTVHVLTDPRGAQTTYTYGACNGMYVTNISHPLNVSESMNWDCNGGAVISATDANSKTTTYSYTNPSNGVGDPFWRATRVNRPDGGQVTTTYNDTASPQNVATNQLIDNSGHSISTQTNFDALGRVSQTALTTDPDGASYTATTYDALGRPFHIYNPTRCNPPTANCGNENTWGYVTNSYDALGRLTQTVEQDGQTVTNNYALNCVTTTDEAGKGRKSCVDGLGRLTQVFEDPAGLNYETDYAYDALDNLQTVTQKGGTSNAAQWRVRTFAYDSLSRLTSATNPESGTITYAYDANGNLTSKTSPAPNQTGSATVTLSYCYDALNRLTSKAYTAQSCPMSSPIATYAYDQTSFNGLTITNGIGRRTGMTDQAGSQAWSYDSMGRIVADMRTTAGFTKQISYTYNLDGSLLSLSAPSYPDGSHPLTATYQQGGAGRPLSINTPLITNAHYTPAGALCYLQRNWDGQFTTNATFSPRLQPKTIQASLDQTSSPVPPPICGITPTYQGDGYHANFVDLTYTYVDANGHNNGNVATIANNVMPERTQNYTYDSLNRIATAQTVDTNQPDWNGDPYPNTECWAEQYSYDGWGNLLAVAPGPSAYTGCVQESGFDFTSPGAINSKNQISVAGYAYDAAGNLIAAPPTGTTYTYDAENHLTSTGGVTYTYDGDGRRVTKSSGTIYSYLPSGEVLMESYLSNGYEQYFYYYFNGQRVANTNNLNVANEYGWYFTDHLGSTRFYWQWDGDGGFNRSDFYPFGGEVVISSDEPSHFKFTGKERDSESGLDNFGARYNSSNLGRFMSADEPLLDQEPRDPQSWNLYSYVRNNPLNNTDPTGNYCVPDGNGGWKNEGSFGQSCQEAVEPEREKFTYQGGSQFGAFFLNFFFSFSNAANDLFRPITNLMGVQPSYMQNIPAGSGPGAATGAATATAATFFIGPEAEGITLTTEGLEHVAAGHMVGGAKAILGKKSIFSAGEDVATLIKAAERTTPVRQATGNFQRIVDAGRPIGIDRTTGAPTSTYTVITKPNGNLVTAFPGKP